jgi:Lon protease-like protein
MVFFPGTTKPLNVFEPRYVRMVQDAVENETLIALAYADSRRTTEGGVRPVAGAGRPVILDVRNDGTMLILVEGVGKVKLNARAHGESEAKVGGDWIEETNALERENVFLLNRVEKEFTKWLQANVGDRQQLAIFLSQLKSPFEKINYFCSLMIYDAETQYRLLTVNDVNERLREISSLLNYDRQFLSL